MYTIYENIIIAIFYVIGGGGGDAVRGTNYCDRLRAFNRGRLTSKTRVLKNRKTKKNILSACATYAYGHLKILTSDSDREHVIAAHMYVFYTRTARVRHVLYTRIRIQCALQYYHLYLTRDDHSREADVIASEGDLWGQIILATVVTVARPRALTSLNEPTRVRRRRSVHRCAYRDPPPERKRKGNNKATSLRHVIIRIIINRIIVV